MSRTFLCSDPHLGHRLMTRVRTYGTGGRFDSVEQHDAFVADAWRRRVGSDDVVIVLGDVAFGRRGLDILANLPGRKKLVMGNHDRMDMRAYLEVFRSVRAYRVVDGDVLLAHMPVHQSALWPRYRAQVHGHTHARRQLPLAVDPISLKPLYLNVCPEAVGYAPLPLEDALRRLPPRRNPPVRAT